MKILVAGAGIGGLTLAVALQRKGFEVAVFERVAELKPVGAGLVVQINAMRAFAHLGLDQAVRRAGFEADSTAIRHWRGRTLTRTSVREFSTRLGQPTVCTHRARLHEALLGGLRPGTLTLGRAVDDWVERADGVDVTLGDGSVVRGDLLVGCDGLHSKVRAKMLGEGPLRYSGMTSWRGVCPIAGLDVNEVSETWGPGLRFGLVPIGHGELYWFATANTAAGGVDGDVRTELLNRFGGWHDPIARVLSATPVERIVRTDVNDRVPVPNWVRGRVALLGDAAHPMTPNFGQGACQAIEDAVVLAEALASTPSWPAALARWQRTRVPRANRVVTQAAQFGRVAQLENPLARLVRDVALGAFGRFGGRGLEALFDFSPTTLAPETGADQP